MQEMPETRVRSLGWKDSHSSTLAWRIPQTEEPGGLHFNGIAESDVTEHTRGTQVLDECLKYFLSSKTIDSNL